jgi:hypothetical protein
MLSFKNEVREGQTGPVWRFGTSGRGEDVRQGCRRVNMVDYYILMFVNGEMRYVETIPGMGGRG